MSARCWLPHHLARQWLAAHNYSWPAHFDPLKPVSKMTAAAPRKRGRKPALRWINRRQDASRDRIRLRHAGAISRHAGKETEAKYQVSRDTARKARNDVWDDP